MSKKGTFHYTSEDRLLLKELFRYGSITNFYKLHELFLLSPAQISNSIRKLVYIGFATFDGEKLELIPKGREYILRQRKEIFCENIEQFWKQASCYLKRDYYVGDETDKLYKIKMSKLDSKYFSRELKNENIEGVGQ